jgi:hypothetical protein
MDGRELTAGRRRNFQGHCPPQCNGSHAGDREHKTPNIGSDCLDDPRLLQVPDIGRDTEPAIGDGTGDLSPRDIMGASFRYTSMTSAIVPPAIRELCLMRGELTRGFRSATGR